MIAVVDASAATEFFVGESDSDTVRAVWIQVELSAPTVLLAELAAAVRRGVGRDPERRAVHAVDYVRRSAQLRDVDDHLALRAAALAAATGVRGMDAIYLATALEVADHGLDVALLSFDGRQREAALDLGIAVIPAEVDDA
jgi:predicted nucleic acid-binding protein